MAGLVFAGTSDGPPRPAAEAADEEAVEHLSLSPRERLRMGLRIGVTYAIAALVLSISFGVLAAPIMGNVGADRHVGAGLRGSAQFASTAVLGAGGGALAAVIPGILLNLRYVPMGIAPPTTAPRPWAPARRRSAAGGRPVRRPADATANSNTSPPSGAEVKACRRVGKFSRNARNAALRTAFWSV